MGSCNTWAPDDWTVDIEERVYTMMYLISCTMLVLPGDWFQKPTSSSSFLYQRTERLRSCFGSTRHSNIAGSPSATNTWGLFIFIVCSSFSIFFNISLHVFLLHSFFRPLSVCYRLHMWFNSKLWAFYLSFSFFEAFRPPHLSVPDVCHEPGRHRFLLLCHSCSELTLGKFFIIKIHEFCGIRGMD